MAMLAEYNIGYGSFAGSYLETNNITTSLNDKYDIIPYLKNLVTKGILKPTQNSYYPMHFAPKTRITQGSSISCFDFCGYHGTIDISQIYNGSTKYLYYGVLPDQTGSYSDPYSCYGACGGSSDSFLNLCSISSHELAEAATNPAVAVATKLGKPLAWYNKYDGEVGDFCNLQEFTYKDPINGTTWVLQKIWSNYYESCSTIKQGYFGSVKPIPSTSTSTLTQTSNLTYYGGPLSTSISTTILYYGPASTITNSSQLLDFYSYIVTSPYMDFLIKEYSVPPNYTITHGSTTLPQSIPLPLVQKTVLDDDKDIKPFLRSFVNQTSLPKTNNSYFPVHFPPGISITRRGAISCKDFCSYHGVLDVSSLNSSNATTKYLYYAIFPDCSMTGSSCGIGFNAVTRVASGQLAAVVTNPGLSLANGLGGLNMGWYEGKNGFEVHDACGGVGMGMVGGFKVHGVWSNTLRNHYFVKNKYHKYYHKDHKYYHKDHKHKYYHNDHKHKDHKHKDHKYYHKDHKHKDHKYYHKYIIDNNYDYNHKNNRTKYYCCKHPRAKHNVKYYRQKLVNTTCFVVLYFLPVSHFFHQV
ncbi:UNVERIFIED_CONTAM: hypothetical protein HDU68_002010 [Siphonaria sp. JEL0065]|nr:hypothetical protein HDU68_002010 [Siphonaria sp. JEL0065]